jgi:transposase
MTALKQAIPEPAAIRTDLGAIIVSLELSRSTWLITSLSPGSGEKMSRHVTPAGDLAKLLELLERLQERARSRTGQLYRIVAIQEAGLDGFWLHRALVAAGVESHIVDAASVAVSRRRRRPKTDRIDGEALLRKLMAWLRKEPRVCSMVRPPSPEAEDRRRLVRERRTLIAERTAETNRIKGLLFAQGVFGFSPLGRDRRRRLETLVTGDGRPLPEQLTAQIARGLDRLELISAQIAAVEAERDRLLAAAAETTPSSPGAMLARLKGIGPELAAVLWSEALYKSFDNRRQLAAYAGLAASPWRSGKVDHEQGISKSGNPRLRTSLIQLAWGWLRHQPNSALSRWFVQRVAQAKGKDSRKKAIVALARKLLVALWKYVTLGVLPDGAELKLA